MLASPTMPGGVVQGSAMMQPRRVREFPTMPGRVVADMAENMAEMAGACLAAWYAWAQAPSRHACVLGAEAVGCPGFGLSK